MFSKSIFVNDEVCYRVFLENIKFANISNIKKILLMKLK